MLAVCAVQCTSCTECDLVLVACITDAAPILKEWEYMHDGAYDVGSYIILLPPKFCLMLAKLISVLHCPLLNHLSVKKKCHCHDVSQSHVTTLIRCNKSHEGRISKGRPYVKKFHKQELPFSVCTESAFDDICMTTYVWILVIAILLIYTPDLLLLHK